MIAGFLVVAILSGLPNNIAGIIRRERSTRSPTGCR